MVEDKYTHCIKVMNIKLLTRDNLLFDAFIHLVEV